MSRRDWALFATMGVVWGMPYLLIRVAVRYFAPPVVVFGRTSLAAALLTMVALRTDRLRPALEHWRPVLAFAALEMAGPWLLLTHAEQRLPSGLTGLLIASVPIIGVLTSFALGDRTVLDPVRLGGVALGLVGVVLLVGDDIGGTATWSTVAEVVLVCIGYATAPFIVARRLVGVPALGVTALSLGAVAALYAPFALVAWPEVTPPARAFAAIAALALVCTALAFVVFFTLIASVGPARATLCTYVNPAVALVLGALFLGERITAVTIGGFVLVLAGCAAATRASRSAAVVVP